MDLGNVSVVWLKISLLFVFCFAAEITAACEPYPVPIRIGNVSLSNGKSARGIDLGIGEPEQAFAFMPQWQNSYLLYGTDGFCTPRDSNAWTKDGCITFRGGGYDALKSTTRKAASADTFPDDSGWPDVNRIADKMRLNKNVTVGNIPMGIALSDWGAQGYHPMMGIGLGSNSTMLSVLKSSGTIASRSWSFFWGRGLGMTSQLDGHLVFGGYDKAKVTGKRYTQSMTANVAQCASQLVVAVTNLELNFANGTSLSIFPISKSSAISTCIDPGLPVMMRMPLDPYIDNFLNRTDNSIYSMTRSLGYHYWNLRYLPPLIPYDGAMTITLSSGLSVRVSNDQLVLPNVYFDQQAGDILTNGTGPDLLIDSMQDVNANDMAQLGSMFLSSAYLQVNQDAGQFSLWAANPTSDEDLVAMDANDLESSDFCASSDQQNVDSGSNSSSTTPQSTNTSSSLSAASVAPLGSGTIVGIAVAVVALGAITGGVGFWLFKRKSRSNQSEPSVHPQTRIYNDPSKPSEAGSDYIPELMDQTPRTFEAPSKSSRAQPAHRYELSS